MIDNKMQLLDEELVLLLRTIGQAQAQLECGLDDDPENEELVDEMQTLEEIHRQINDEIIRRREAEEK